MSLSRELDANALLNEIEKTDRHLQHVKEESFSTREADRQTIQRLQRQNNALKKALQTTSEEADQQIKHLERQLQYASAECSYAREQIKSLVQDKEELLKLKKDSSVEIANTFQRNSKYSSQQYNILSTTLNAVRVELKRTREEK